MFQAALVVCVALAKATIQVASSRAGAGVDQTMINKQKTRAQKRKAFKSEVIM